MPRKSIGVPLKKLVVSRAGGYCEYCKSPADFATEPFSIEHIIPRAKQGGDEDSNLAYACIGCNVYKSDQTESLDLVSQEVTTLFNPRVMVWNEHFSWDTSVTKLIGKTACGRATIEALRLNRRPLVNLRRALIAIGEHPPMP